MPVDTADSLPVKTVVEKQIPLAPATLVRTAQPPTPATQAVELKSKKGIDYTRLRDLLKAGEWRDADLETWHRMLEVIECGKVLGFIQMNCVTFPIPISKRLINCGNTGVVVSLVLACKRRYGRNVAVLPTTAKTGIVFALRWAGKTQLPLET